MDSFNIPDLFQQEASDSALFLHAYATDTHHHQVKVSLNCHLLSFVEEGEKVVTDRAGVTRIGSSHFVALRAGRCLMTEHLSETGRYASLLLFFPNGFLGEFIARHGFQPKKLDQAPDFRTFFQDEFVRHFVASLKLLGGNGRRVSQRLLAAKLEELLLYLVEVEGAGILDYLAGGGLLDPELEFKRTVEGNLGNKLTLEELAFLCHMSRSTFKRKFQQHYGVPPHKWFSQKRLERAAFLLGVEGKTPSEVYHVVGYESLSSFIQAFKRSYDQTPKQYQLAHI